MGESYLTDSAKTQAGDEFNNLHATFARPITIFKTAQQVVISTNPAHNFLFQDAPMNDIVQNVIQSGVFPARILYGKREDLTQFAGANNQQPVIRLKEGEARIKLDPTGAAFLQGVDRVTFDNTIFDLTTSQRPHGLFDPNFYTFYLKKIS